MSSIENPGWSTTIDPAVEKALNDAEAEALQEDPESAANSQEQGQNHAV